MKITIKITMTPFTTRFSLLQIFITVFIISVCEVATQNVVESAEPFITKQNTAFGPFIEGSSPDVHGNMYAVNYGVSESECAYPQTLGQFYPNQSLLYIDFKPGTRFNGMRFVNRTHALAADKVNHRIVQLEFAEMSPGQYTVKKTSDFCQNANIIQPNDIAISRKGTIFLSSWNEGNYTNDVGNGDIWSCTPNGTANLLEVLGRTNGIELSPDEKSLYVSESNYDSTEKPFRQRVWVYDVDTTNGTISNKRVLIDFGVLDKTQDINLDGIRTDTEGNIWLVRYGNSMVNAFTPQGKLIRRIKVNFPNPTNLDFGGTEGKTLYIVGECSTKGYGCVDKIETDKVGRAWAELQKTR